VDDAPVVTPSGLLKLVPVPPVVPPPPHLYLTSPAPPVPPPPPPAPPPPPRTVPSRKGTRPLPDFNIV
jgi:hypothetical protein